MVNRNTQASMDARESALEELGPGSQVSFPNHNAVSSRGCRQWYGIAAARSSDRLRVDRRRAVLAHKPILPFEEANGAADLASIEYRGNLQRKSGNGSWLR